MSCDTGGRILVHTTITGLSLLLNSDEKSLAAVKVKGQSLSYMALCSS